MAFDIGPGNMRPFTVTFSKADGTPGSVEGVPTWELSDITLGALVVNPDGMGGSVQHNGAVGEVTLTGRADGDLGEGVFPIVLSEVFTMKAPLGAVGGALGVGDEVPIA